MATKKEKVPVASKATTSRGTARAVAATASLATPETGNSQRLLREAAWSRMFGRAETKNPFARSRQ
jgi:hypothetical protein